MLVIDEICNMIRENCDEQELVRLIMQYQIEEARILNAQSGALNQESDQIDSSTKRSYIATIIEP